MKKGENHNRPKKGDRITVDPIKNRKDIQSIKKLLSDKPRDSCIFSLGINTNLRGGDLLRLTVDQVKDVKVDESIKIFEQKTGKARQVPFNKNCIDSIRTLLKSRDYKTGDKLFMGQRGPLTVPSLTRLVKSWCQAINLKGNFGSHTLRKTWGYHLRATFGASLPVLMQCFNHSNQKQTLDYLCIQPEEVQDVFKNLL